MTSRTGDRVIDEIDPVQVVSVGVGEFPEKNVYIYAYRQSQVTNVLRAIGRDAANPELNMTWYAAAVICQKIRKGICK